MELREKLNKIENNWSWSFFGFLLALIFGGLAIYSTFIYDRKPNLEFQILTNTKVVDVNEKVSNLKVLYNDNNIAANNQDLSLLSIRMSNTSNSSILKTFYDENSPITIGAINGLIVENPKIEFASNDYLKTNGIPKLDSTNSVTFPNLIMDKDDNIQFQLLVLHSTSQQINLQVDGKIANQEKISISDISDIDNSNTIWKQINSGPIWIKLIRFFYYLFSFAFLMMAIVIPTTKVSEIVSKRKREKLIEKYKSIYSTETGEMFDKLVHLYINNEKIFVHRAEKLVNDETLLIDAIEELNLPKEFRELDGNHHLYLSKRYHQEVAEVLKKSGIITEDNETGDPIVNQEFKNHLQKLNDFLKIKSL